MKKQIDSEIVKARKNKYPLGSCPENTGEIQEARDNKGRFMPGISGNPKGKPLGAKHMTTLLMDALREIPNGHGKPADILIVQKLIQKALQGHDKSIELIWNRIEGKETQSLNIASSSATIVVSKEKQAMVDEALARYLDESN
jgi:hypothetical protein